LRGFFWDRGRIGSGWLSFAQDMAIGGKQGTHIFVRCARALSFLFLHQSQPRQSCITLTSTFGQSENSTFILTGCETKKHHRRTNTRLPHPLWLRQYDYHIPGRHQCVDEQFIFEWHVRARVHEVGHRTSDQGNASIASFGDMYTNRI
jgi:hypothetical protein